MPIVRIYGVPPKTRVKTLEALIGRIQEATSNIEKMEVTKEQVTVFFPVDRVEKGLGEEIVAYIDFFNRKKRKKELATAVGELLAKVFPRTGFIEVLPLGYNSKKEGYWSIRR